ncbi:hypothetical protein D3C86_2131340 [compost metagenome]
MRRDRLLDARRLCDRGKHASVTLLGETIAMAVAEEWTRVIGIKVSPEPQLRTVRLEEVPHLR